MLAEGPFEEVEKWLKMVRGLRYEDMTVMRKMEVKKREMEVVGIEKGTVRELGGLEEFGALVGREDGLKRWWREGMGWLIDEEGKG